MSQSNRRELTWYSAVLLWLAVLAGGAQAQDRSAIYLTERQHQDWRAVGRISYAGFDSKHICTGTLVAPSLVLTAAHCLPDTVAVEDLVFAAGWFKETRLAVRRGAKVLRANAPPEDLPPNLRALRGDVALLRLTQPITKVAPLPLAPAGTLPPLDKRLAFVGYSLQRRYALSGRFDCQPRPAPEGLVVTDCDVIQGHSGAPLMAWGPAGWLVVAVVVARGQMGAPATFATLPPSELLAHLDAMP